MTLMQVEIISVKRFKSRDGRGVVQADARDRHGQMLRLTVRGTRKIRHKLIVPGAVITVRGEARVTRYFHVADIAPLGNV